MLSCRRTGEIPHATIGLCPSGDRAAIRSAWSGRAPCSIPDLAPPRSRDLLRLVHEPALGGRIGTVIARTVTAASGLGEGDIIRPLDQQDRRRFAGRWVWPEPFLTGRPAVSAAAP